ncbi:MAG: AAA family ATPase, partial [Cytophagales bacterium]|nr:AAA family ATPase [Armatimonadota bacterium]
IWRESLLRRMDTPPDLVFASEPYGFKLAETLGATYVPVDHARDRIPISGTRLRADPLRHWEHLLPPARPYFARRFALVGPESSGKSTLTSRLAAHFRADFAAEYARDFLAAVPDHWIGTDGVNRFREASVHAILRGQEASVEAMVAQSERGILFSDTEAIVTACWSRVLLGFVPPLAEEFIRRQRYDRYLVQSASESWTDDASQRVQPAFDERKRFEESCVAHLEQHGFPYVRLEGTWAEREAQAIAAVERSL